MRRLRSRTAGGGPAQGRWSLIRQHVSGLPAGTPPITVTQWSVNIAQQLLVRHGIVLRETAIAENIPRGYPTIYPALKTMEDGGWVRRGMFVAGLGAAQFAMPSAVDMLRSLRSEPQTPEALFLTATDPANPYGTLLPWPRKDSDDAGDNTGGAETTAIASDASSETSAGAKFTAKAAAPAKKTAADVRGLINTDAANSVSLPAMSRTRGAGVILINGGLAAFFRRQNPAIRVFLPESEPELSRFSRELGKKLAEIAIRRQGRKTGLLIGTINDVIAREHFLARFLEEAGFVDTTWGFQMRRVTPIPIAADDIKEAANGAANDDEVDEPEITGSA